MTQQKQPTTEQGPQEKAATPWRVRFTCGKAKPSYSEARKDLLTATWGNNRMADLLYHFLVVASWEAHNSHLGEATKKVIVQETHAKIQTKVKVSEPTLVSHLKAFASAGYVRKTAYRGAFEVDFETIEKAFTEAPEKQSTSATSTDDLSLSLNLSLSQEVKELRLEVQKLREEVRDLSLTLVSFKFQHAQSEHGFKFNLSLPLVSEDFDEAATEANLAHIFKFAETKELYLNNSSGLALADGSGAQNCPKNILDIRGLEDLDRERLEGANAPTPTPVSDIPYLPSFMTDQDKIHIADDTEQPASEEKSTVTEPAGGSGYEKAAVQQNLTGASTQGSAHVEQVDIKKLSLQVHVDYVFRWLDEIKKEAKRDVRANYVKNATSEKLIKDLITACWNTDKELTRENVRKAWRQMWNSKPGSTGWSWKKAGISIKAFTENYGEYLEKAWDEEAQAHEPAAAPVPTVSTPTVSGLRRWVPPSQAHAQPAFAQ